MKTKMVKIAYSIFFTLCLILIFSGPVMSGQTYNLKFASEYPDKHPTVKNAFFPWIEEVKKLSDNRLNITFYNPNALAPAKQVWDAVTAGIVDITGSPCHWVHGKLKTAPVIQLPMMFNGAEAGSLTTWELSQKTPEWQKEYSQVKTLWHWTGALYEIHMKKEMVKTLGDLRGKKMIGWNPQIREVLKKLGANPVEVTPHDSYLALERGMADGIACPIAPMKVFKISDVVKYHTIVDLMADPFYAVINKRTWNSLPDDLKKILEDTTGEKMAQLCGKTLDEGSIADSEWMKEKGHKFYVLPDDEKLKWRQAVSSIHDEWIKKAEQKGIRNARKIRDETVRLGEVFSAQTVGGYKK